MQSCVPASRCPASKVNVEKRRVFFFLAALHMICEGRRMHQLLRTSPLVFVFALAACGGSTPPPNDATSSEKDAAPGGGSGSSAALEEERKAFMSECMESPELKDFCACSWDNVSKTTTAEERKDVDNPNTKKALAALPDQCGNKMPKQALKENFIKSCAKSAAMEPFCECSYKFLDGKGMLTSGAEGVAKVEGEMKAACSNELFELGKAAFLDACGQNQDMKICQCTFGSLEKKYGKAKLQSMLESGSQDAKNAARAAAASCGGK